MKRASSQKSGNQPKVDKNASEGAQLRAQALVTGCIYKQAEGLDEFSYPCHKNGTITIKTNGRVTNSDVKIANKKQYIRHIRNETLLWE